MYNINIFYDLYYKQKFKYFWEKIKCVQNPISGNLAKYILGKNEVRSKSDFRKFSKIYFGEK
jgi:hypothetical protein